MHRLQAPHLPGSSADLSGLHPHLAIRQLGLPDQTQMSRLLQRLELQARLDRFGHDMSDAALQSYARDSLANSPAAFGALFDQQLIGVAEITRLAPADAAMLAFVVDGQWRRQGIGCRLLLTALAWAAKRDMTSVQLRCTRTNWAVRQIAQKANARISLTTDQFLADFAAKPPAEFVTDGPTQ
jgi:GNAT superfamily N-acetyltransferase